MSIETWFLICNYGVVPAWLLLIVAPGWSGTQRAVHAVWIPLLLGSVYAVTLLTSPPAPDGASFATLPGVQALFTSPHAVLAGWVHYLVFDLFVGAWEVRDARRLGIRHPWVVPSLVLTCMLGPVGLLAYLTTRFALRRTVELDETRAL